MKNALSIVGVASLLLVSFALPGDQPRFSVKEKTRLSKVFDGKIAFHSTGITIKVDGNEIDSPASGAKINLEELSHVELQDTYGAAKDGQPAKVERSYDKLEGKNSRHIELPEGSPGQAPPDTAQDRKSALEGKKVVFTLGEDGEYKAAFADGKGEAELLEDLEEDMDLRALLPDAAVEVDKSWKIDAKAFHSVLNLPGGDLKMKSEDEKENAGKVGKQLQANAKGKAKGTYKGMREEGGKKYAVVALEAELDSKAEVDESGSDPHSGGGSTEIKVGYSVEGELLWDAEAGHFHACKMESKATLKVTNKGSMSRGDEKHEFERTTEFEGEGEFKASVED